MNKEQLEKIFDEKFWIAPSYERIKHEVYTNDMKQFIFETIISEVLKSIIPNFTYNKDTTREDCFDEIKQRAKDLYWIEI